MYCRTLPSWNPLDQKQFYPPMSLNPPAPFGGGIDSKAVTSSLLGEGSSLKVGSFSFGSPVSASAVSKPIFVIKANEHKTKICTPMISGSVKKSYPFVLWLQAPHQKSVLVGLASD